MSAVKYVALAVVLAGQACALGTLPRDEYPARRARLAAALPDGVTVLFGRGLEDSAQSRSGFVQEPNFLYLTGWGEPDAILMIAPGDGSVLFLPERDTNRERYFGRSADALDPGIAQTAGFDRVLPASRFAETLGEAVRAHPKVYALAATAQGQRVRAMFPNLEVADAVEAIGRLRLRKSPAEIAMIRRSLAVTAEAHRSAWRRIRPGAYEYQVAAALVGSYLDGGCERSAYAPIVASGPAAVTLHYSANGRRMQSGELVLMDSGAECSGYASDLTRTVPVAGKFTPRQRELYSAVLGAEQAVLGAIGPGAEFARESPRSLTRIAQQYLDAHGKDAEGRPLGRHLTHLVGHHVGLEVHDAGALVTSSPLEPGMVVTVEVGIYIEAEGIGIRVEDMVVVTGKGADLLDTSLPKEPAAIEKAMAR